MFFCCVYQSLSDFFLGETFSSRRTERERRKRSQLQKEKKDNNNKRDDESAQKKKQSRDSLRDFETRDTVLRENKRNFLLLFRNALLF